MDHFLNPKHMGEMKDYSAVGTTENLKCGDAMRIYIKVKNDKITDIKFTTLGCAPAIAASDMICDLALGKTIEQAKNISYKDVAGKLGDLPVQKMHCTQLAETALQSALDNYKGRNK